MIRLKASQLMGVQLTDSLRAAWISKPLSFKDTSGDFVNADFYDINSRITASNRIHHAHTGTGAIDVAVASLIKGLI